MIVGQRVKRVRHHKGLAIENRVCGIYIFLYHVKFKTIQSVYLGLEVAHFIRPHT